LTVLEFDPQTMQEGFSRVPFEIKHNLSEHPLLTLDRLAQLADFLPENQVEHNVAVDVPAVLPGGNAPRLDATPGEVARGIESNGCWMVLKHAELDPEYRDLLHEALSDAIPLVEDRVGGATKEQAFIFLTAPNATTPLHTDPEENFLLQVKAKKQIEVGTWPNSEIEHAHLERYYAGGHRNIDEMPPNSKRFILDPGDGVHVPLNAPHWVKNFDEVSISFSITFNTAQSEFLNDVYAMNARLRKLRLSPEPPGSNPSSDKAKAAVWRNLRRGKNLVQSVSGNGSD
jgi:hypothetical protein